MELPAEHDDDLREQVQFDVFFAPVAVHVHRPVIPPLLWHYMVPPRFSQDLLRGPRQVRLPSDLPIPYANQLVHIAILGIMQTNDMITLVHDSYKAFAKGGKAFFENNLADNFTFSAPPDPLVTRAEYLKRWSESGAKPQPTVTIVRTIVQGNEVVITYERQHEDGSKGRNTEIHTVEGGKIERTEVYWGWNIEK